jgi:hypothetical protein
MLPWWMDVDMAANHRQTREVGMFVASINDRDDSVTTKKHIVEQYTLSENSIPYFILELVNMQHGGQSISNGEVRHFTGRVLP